MQSLQADDLKEKEKENEKLLNDLEEKQTKCSKLVTKLLSCFFLQLATFSLSGEIHCYKLFLAAPLSSTKNSCEWCSIDLKWLRSICLNWMTSCNYMLMLKFILNCCILIPPFNLKISCNKADNKIQKKYHMCSQGELAMSCWNVSHFMSSCSNSARGNQTVWL